MTSAPFVYPIPARPDGNAGTFAHPQRRERAGVAP